MNCKELNIVECELCIEGYANACCIAKYHFTISNTTVYYNNIKEHIIANLKSNRVSKYHFIKTIEVFFPQYIDTLDKYRVLL